VQRVELGDQVGVEQVVATAEGAEGDGASGEGPDRVEGGDGFSTR